MGSGATALSVVVLVHKSGLERLKQQQNMEETIVQDLKKKHAHAKSKNVPVKKELWYTRQPIDILNIFRVAVIFIMLTGFNNDY